MSQLNKSTSKQQFSFCKSVRFSDRQNTLPLCYDKQPSQKIQGGVIGTTKRSDPTATTVESPAPKYQIKSLFDINVQKKKGNNMGTGRDRVLGTNYSYINLNSNPGPGNYETIENKPKGMTIGLKTRIPCHVLFLNDKSIPDTPGPGKYKQTKRLSAGGKILSTTSRFRESKGQVPGPGHYDRQLSVSSISRSVDRHNSSMCAFPKQKRLTFMDEAIRRSEVPGPGKYKLHSEFQGRSSSQLSFH